MAGRGPAPKPADRRARRNAGPELRVVEAEPAPQPELPEFEWPDQTRAWWAEWAEYPLSSEFTAADWRFLLDTAVIHAAFWSGDTKAAAELRLRVAKFGVTPEDRARLRITFAQADRADAERPAAVSSARERYGSLQSVG